MTNLNFEWIVELREYRIYNKKEEHIGNISLEKIGRWSHWSLNISKYLMQKMIGNDEYLIFSPGCQDEIRQFCKELNSNRRNSRVR